MKKGPVLALVVLGCAAVAGGALWIGERNAPSTPAAETETPPETPTTGVPAPPGPSAEPESGTITSGDPPPGSPENPVRLQALAFPHPNELFPMLGIERDPEPWQHVRNPMDHPDWDIVSKLELGELRQRAETGDHLARHALAWRIGHEQPLEAHEIWRRLAAEGSGIALQMVARSYEAACPYDALPAPDLSACRHFVAEVMTMAFSGYACPGR